MTSSPPSPQITSAPVVPVRTSLPSVPRIVQPSALDVTRTVPSERSSAPRKSPSCATVATFTTVPAARTATVTAIDTVWPTASAPSTQCCCCEPLQVPVCGTTEMSVAGDGRSSVTITLLATAVPRFETESWNVTAPPIVVVRGSTLWLIATFGAGSACHEGTASLVGANGARAAPRPSAFASHRSAPRRNASLLPSGEKAAPWSPALACTSCAWPRPVAVIDQIASAPLRPDVNAMLVPSEDQAAWRSSAASRVSRRSPEPLGLTVTMSAPP